jgi:hypothetical protein
VPPPIGIFDAEANILETMRAMDSSGASVSGTHTFHHHLAQMRRFRAIKEKLDNTDVVECYKLALSKGLV